MFTIPAGANGDEDTYLPQLTSYDYDAPLTEAGDPTPKYFEIRDVISKVQYLLYHIITYKLDPGFYSASH